jgi:LPXTG-motif cell wall-anchored protein
VIVMARVRAYLVTVIILALAVHLVWVAVAPLIPFTIGGLIVLSALGLLYFRKRW